MHAVREYEQRSFRLEFNVDGLMCGMSRYKNYKFAQAGAGTVQIENRQMRRLRKKK